jgi:chromosome segregation ATPase
LADTTEDLSEHKSTLTDERSQRAQEAAEQASIIKSQGEDLACHQEALAELEPELAAQVKVSKELAEDLEGHRAHLTELESGMEAHQLAVSNLQASLMESEQVREREAAAGAQVVEELKGEIAARGNLVKELEASLAGNQKQNLHLGELLSEERSLREELTQTLGQQLKDLAADRDSVLETLAGVQQHRTEVLGLLQETQAGAESLEAALQASQAEEARQRAEIERLRQLVGSRLESFKLVFKPERPGV